VSEVATDREDPAEEVYVVRLYLPPRRLVALHQAVRWADLSAVPPIARALMQDVVTAAKRLEGRRLVRGHTEGRST
jgi:hypothetical protein